ncbi:Imm10 family immunity protein (plasmid) [Streptomyces sp. NBC_00841]|uniref:Imm10 family immunity protein n=1 Tax=unclassified Streptomyces TaxID=2593676 RepID=UPI002251EF71|nr:MULTISPECIES: Imm10 family immunity protein [unclassified Streptomyces]MCX4537657.1 Imm10 family immunity protein [Streptomyces sp. NBC_01669]WSA05848.1 Imm10 family immunity protein [Streptomyces sp. NBC_00841]
MTHRFTARVVAAGVDLDNDVMQAGFAEDEAGDGFFLLFMSNIGEPSRQNVTLGLDSHCLVTQDQGTAYGCVREVTLSNGLLTVSLDPASLDDLGLADTTIEAQLDVPDEDIERMRDVLVQVLAFGREENRPQRVDL